MKDHRKPLTDFLRRNRMIADTMDIDACCRSYGDEMTRGLGRTVIDASNNDATVGAFRREMIECVEAATVDRTK